jgi:mannose-6-phosphate isomerase
VQVHPIDKYAKAHPSVHTKNEAWYVLDAKPHASIIYGHNAKTKNELIALSKAGKWNKLLREIPVHSGELFYVPSGTLHALKAGLIILEVQQASDTTFRLYDYDRDKTDSNRKLTVKEAVDNIAIPFIKPKIRKTLDKLLTVPYFSMQLIKNSGVQQYSYPQAQWLQCVVINGEGSIDDINIIKGSTFLIGNNHLSFTIKGNLQIILSYIRK